LSLTACKESRSLPATDTAVVTATHAQTAIPPKPDTTSLPFDDDTGAVVAPGPVVVAAFPVTQAQVDSSEDVATALEDFQTYLPGIADSVRRLGVKFAVRFKTPVRVSAGGQSVTWAVSNDSGGVGYLMLAPGKAPKTLWGIHTSLGEEAREYFAPAPDR
jgi:hypothetical protein